MAKKAKAGDGNNGVTNLTETKTVVREAVAELINIKTQQSELNSRANAARKRVAAYGVPPAALNLALRMKQADPEDRQKHDEGYAIARDALGLGLQRSLFEQLEERVGAEEMVANGTAKREQKPKGAIGEALAASREHLGTNGAAAPVPDAVTA